MGRFVEGRDRRQTALLPECLDDYVEADNPVRVIDAFVDGLDLFAIGFSGVQPASTGRPAYHPAMMLKLYVYGYLNQLCSSRRLEREAGRNVELMWLTGKLAPDFKTIADFRRDNAEPIKLACQQFIAVCRSLGLLAGSVVAIDGSKFRAINTHERNYTRAKLARRMAEVEANIVHYMAALDAGDRAEADATPPAKERLADKLAALRKRMAELKEVGERLETASDGQISLTDPDARAMATAAERRGVVGYNVQAAVDANHHLIIAHEVTNTGSDRAQLAGMAIRAKDETAADELTVLADRGYYDGDQILACEKAGIAALVPKPDTSPARAKGQWSKDDFVYEPGSDTYRCPMGERLTRRFPSVEEGKTIHIYFNTAACQACAARARCTTGRERRIRRWEHEEVLEVVQQRLNATPDAMHVRGRTVEHVFATLKHWMGATHFRTKGLKNVSAEMSLSVLAYNLKRTIVLVGVSPILVAIKT
jgi:transposase